MLGSSIYPKQNANCSLAILTCEDTAILVAGLLPFLAHLLQQILSGISIDILLSPATP